MKKILAWLLYGAALFLLAGSCSKNNIWIGGDSEGGGDASGGTSLITFVASVEGRNMTRSLTPLRINVRSKIFAYAGSNDDASGSPLSSGSYQAVMPGQLQGEDDFKMYLPNGIYNFYAVSDNTQFPAPAFSGAMSDPLENGIDYLWWGGRKLDVTASQAGVPIVFMHSATQVVFEVRAGQGISINSLALAHIYASAEGGVMNLATGIITPATAYGTMESKMGVGDRVAQYTMLPVKSDAPLRVSFDVFLAGEPSTRTYSVEVPASMTGGEFKAGNSYRFLAVIQGTEVTFPSVNVTSWVDVDETGTPLYPSEM